jgi:hypothetical protein
MPPTSSGRSEMAHNQDWREWLESLNASGVEYVVVGGRAAGRPQDIADIERLGG